MVVHSCSLNLQHSRSGGFVEIGVLNEKRSRAGLRGGRNLDGEMNDAESGGLLGDDGDVAGPEMVYAMLVSKPDCEKRQMSAAIAAEAGRARGMGFPARLQALVEVL